MPSYDPLAPAPGTFDMGALSTSGTAVTNAVSNQAAGGAINTGISGATTQAGYTPVAGVPAATGTGQTGPGFFGQGGGASIALGAIQTLGSLWNSFQQTKLAKESLSFQKQAFQTNLKNQTQSYNTALEDRVSTRHASNDRGQDTEAYLTEHRL